MKQAIKFGIAAGAFLLWTAGAAQAAPPAAQYSPQDIVKTFSKPATPPAPPTAGAPAPPAGECEKRGMVAGEDGICEPAKDERGFSLPTRSTMGAAAAKKTVATPAAHVQNASISAPRPAPPPPVMHRDLMITFKNNSADLTEQARVNAKAFVEALSNPALAGTKFEIAGYTNQVGPADKNMTLSQKRAEAVKAFITARGIDSSRIVAKGYGASDFAVPNDPSAAANRRVEARRVDN